jgi:hypothetical protein
MLALPDLAWGVWGRLEPVGYPASWYDARQVVRQHESEGAIVVLPFQPFRSFPWNDRRTVLDPFPRFAGVEAVWPDALTVGTQRIAGEDPRAARVYEALASGTPLERLRDAGVGLVVVQRDTPGQVSPELTVDLEQLYISAGIEVYRVPGDVAEWPYGASPLIVVAIDVAVLMAIAGVLGWLIVVRTREGR